MSLFFGGSGGSLFYGQGGEDTASSQGGVNLEAIERSGRRTSLLSAYANDLVTSAPDAALALAESPLPDDEMLRSATESSNYASIQNIAQGLSQESPKVQVAMFKGLPQPIAAALKDLGYRPPTLEEEGGNRWGINLPDILPIDELTIDRDTPILGAIGNLQAGAGEVLETARGAGGQALRPFAWAGELVPHLYRAIKYTEAEEDLGFAEGFNPANYFSPSQLSKSWEATDPDDGYVKPAARARALKIVNNDRLLYDIAHGFATGKTSDGIIEEAGYELDSPEALQMSMAILEAQALPQLEEAVHELSVGQVSFGRTIVQDSLGLDDTDSGMGRILSGVVDAGFLLVSDPTIVGGKATKAGRLGRHAFMLETSGDIDRLSRITQIAANMERSRAGMAALHVLGDIRPSEMRRARGVLNWADRVSEGFTTGRLAEMGRELPNTMPVLSTMSDAHLRRVTEGVTDLSRPDGVIDWLLGRDGLLTLAGSRLGGKSPMAQGLRMPSLTRTQMATLRTKKAFTEAIDWSRLQYSFKPESDTFVKKLSEFTSAVGSPAALTRQVGQLALAQTVGNTGRLLAGLTAHSPYSRALRLYGDESVQEFGRLVNMGIFGRMPRVEMDTFIDDFAKGDLVARANIEERFLEQLFRVTGIGDTQFAQRFVGRHRQAYAVDAGDLVDIGELQTHAGRLVDIHHADALAIPSFKEFLQETRRVNMTRFLFNNTPASWADAALGRWWKPSVLMRIGFIPRAGGEELLHYVLKAGPRRYAGAKGAEWSVLPDVRNDIEARLTEAETLGHVDEINRLQQQLAHTTGGLTAPLRSLAGATDRFWTRLFASDAVELGPIRQRFTDKAHAIDERRVVRGLEQFANEKALWASGAVERLAAFTHMPSKAQIGQVMAERWNPNAVEAARRMATDPRVMRAYAEQISSSTFTPWEFVGSVDANGAPVPKIEWSDRSGGVQVLREIPMKPKAGEYEVQHLLDTGGDVTSFFHSIFNRQMRLRKDRVASSVLNNTLPRWTGTFGPDLAGRLGYDDASGLRHDLNKLWAWEGDGDTTGAGLLGAARKLMDDPDDAEGLRVWLGQHIDQVSGELGLGLDGRTLSDMFMSTELDNAPKHWLGYENVDPDRLIDRWEDLEKQLGHRAKARLSRPDMQRKLQEMRLYSDERLARPTQQGIRKIYVPMVQDLPPVLADDFVEAATRNIRYIGGYSEERARQIAQNVADSLETARDAGMTMKGAKPLSGWGASDPRVADAVMSAADQVLGTRSVHGILEVPEDVIHRAAGDRAQGVRTMHGNWQTADDYLVDAWRLNKTRATGQNRRLIKLKVGDDWWDEVDLRNATSTFNSATRPGTVRLMRGDTGAWGRDMPVDQPFRFVDVPEDVAARYGDNIPDDLAEELGAKRLPGPPPEDGNWLIADREMSEGLGEIEALERVASASMDEVLDVLTTLRRTELDDDVLHEVIEPMLRPDKAWLDDAGNTVTEKGYGFDHLIMGVDWDRLPRETYGPRMVASRDLRWDKIVSQWFEGPVDHAISSMVRKPMFLDNFGQQLTSSKALADLFVDEDIWTAVRASGLSDETLDGIVAALPDDVSSELLVDTVADIAPDLVMGENEILAFRRFVQQRKHGLDMVTQSALNRAVQLTTPFIDDHRIRSAFQNYIGNFMPFQFAEEQFLKRWVRSVSESPEMIRRAQLAMNGIRSMGVIRKDERGNEIFVYPLAGEAVAAISGGVANMFGENLRVPYVGAMTGEVGYTLPGLGQRFGVPSVGPLVAMPLELLSRHFPELADIEHAVSGPGADRPVYSYFIPSWAGRVWESAFGSLDKAQMASATNQAIQTLAINGDMPPENATPAEQQEFIERAQGIARTIIMARGLLGMVAPAAPQFRTKADDLNADYVELLRNSPSPEEATTAFIARNPDIEPADLLASTVFTSESTYAGLPTPTDETFNWVRDNEEIVDGFPAAAPWLMPRAGADDEFSYRAWAQQVAKGLRTRKMPAELVDDIRFAGAARDYFNAKTLHDADLLVSQGAERSQFVSEWNVWKAAYFRQHPVFARMLEDPTREQRRGQAMEELAVLTADPGGPVAPELAEMVERYRSYQFKISGLRGSRSQGATQVRHAMTSEFAAWNEWQVQRYPWLAGFYLRIVKPDLALLDDDAVVGRAS